MNIPKLTLPRWPKGERAQKPVVEGAPLAWCLLLTAVGVAALVGSTWMLLVFVAGSVGHVDWAFSYKATEAGVQESKWHYEASIHLLVGIGLFLFCLSIAMFNATWLETRKHLSGLIRTVVTGIGVAVALFMISGAIVVQQRGTDARARDEVVAAQTAQVGAATAGAQLEQARQTLREMRNHPNQYMAVAATVGAAEFERSYLSAEQRRKETPDRVRLLERSLGAARRADALEADIARLTAGAAQAQTQAVVAEAVSVRADGFMAGPVMFLEDARKPITAVLGELLALTAFSFALAAWQSRRLAEPAEDATPIMIEDHSAEAAPQEIQPMKPAEKREQYYDEDGNKIVRRKATWAKVPTKRSGRKEVDPKTGKMVKDETEYEAPARSVSLNVEAEDAIPDAMDSDGLRVPESDPVVDPEPQTLTPEPEEKTDDLVAAEQDAPLENAADVSLNPAPDVQEPAPIVLPDERIDELTPPAVEMTQAQFEEGVREGFIDEESGEIFSQEGVENIKQADEAPRYPALPAPETEAA